MSRGSLGDAFPLEPASEVPAILRRCVARGQVGDAESLDQLRRRLFVDRAEDVALPLRSLSGRDRVRSVGERFPLGGRPLASVGAILPMRDVEPPRRSILRPLRPIGGRLRPDPRLAGESGVPLARGAGVRPALSAPVARAPDVPVNVAHDCPLLWRPRSGCASFRLRSAGERTKPFVTFARVLKVR